MKPRDSLVALAIMLMWLTAFPARPLHADRPAPADELLLHLKRQAGASLRIAYHAETGKVRFIGVDPVRAIAPPSVLRAGATPREASLSFLAVYGPLFGVEKPDEELMLMRIRAGEKGRSSVRWQQVYNGVPVLGGEIIVQMTAAGALTSMSGELLPDLEMDTTPRIAASAARQIALDQVGAMYGLPVTDLVANEASLWIFSQALLGGPEAGDPRLVWRVDVTPAELLPIRELVLVDALDGGIALQFNQTDAARDRRVYDNKNVPGAGLPGTGPVGTEGHQPPGPYPNDASNAYDYTGFTYDFYRTHHDRDSIDDHGMPLTSTVRYCPNADHCPYSNAFWNGEQMVFGAGFASADDVTAHEMTHGVTRRESGLLYYMQSGAINEALSDIWGEMTDLSYTNGYDNDAPAVRWYLGEDISGGPARYMKDPSEFGHPDRMTSPDFTCGGHDNGGVHTNSGIANKAAFLMVDGGAFNGLSVGGLGINKTAAIWYEVQTGLLTSTANYQDLGDALIQACLVLVGTNGITGNDCDQVEKAVKATEMGLLPIACMSGVVCGDGARQIDLFTDSFESGLSNWISEASVGDNWWQRRHDQPATGVWHLWARDQTRIGDNTITTREAVAMPDLPSIGGPYLFFNHNWGFEQSDDGTNHDGGVVEYSTDGGATWNDTMPFFVQNSYSGVLDDCCQNPLAGRSAFVGTAPGYVPTQLNLEPLRGKAVHLRFRVGTDSSAEDAMGWLIDDVRIYYCVSAVYMPIVTKDHHP